MTMAVQYYGFPGRMVGEVRNGVGTDYLSDTQGSLIGTVDASGNRTSTISYWPYGEVASSSGSNPSPWGYIGLLGYYIDSLVSLYVRARHYRPDKGIWRTVDSRWPSQGAYGYVNQSPIKLFDPAGRKACKEDPCSKVKGPHGACVAFLCSLDTAMDITFLKTIFGDEYLDILKEYGLDTLEHGGKIELPTMDPSDCCKEASGAGKTGPIANIVARLVWLICNRLKQKTCLQMKTESDCKTCCNAVLSGKPNELTLLCLERCEDKFAT
jgi:RHS repeat-associated protein